MSALDTRGLPEGYPYNAEWEITPRELQARRGKPEEPLIVDVRTAQERAIGCIAGSVHIPLADLEAQIETLREHEDREICTLCHHGVRSLRAAAALRRAGFEQVRSVAGGIHLWSVDIDPSIPIY
jgi:rhodanese-related sulfurtransferase